MVHVRMWRPADLPLLTQMAGLTAWELLPADDRAVARFELVAQSGAANLQGVLTSPGGTAIVADVGGQPVGYLLIGLMPDDLTGEPVGYLADIYMQPAWRRRGVSKRLHQAGEQYLRQIGIRKVTNWTHAHNATAIKTQEHHGIRPWRVMLSKRLTGEAAGGSLAL